uniref:Uncharacterized protein n=1 Tax=Amphimedon queenslandica TaxID=400682 RepID=A0A1X7SG76_AMPQE
MLGYGNVPYDKISMIVISTIAVGLGIPLLLIIFGSIYVAFKKKVWQKCSKTGYTKMTNEKEDEDEIKANGGDKINKE